MAPGKPDEALAPIAARLTSMGGVLHDLPEALAARLASSGRLVKASLGQVLIAPAKMPEALFLILEGRVRILGLDPGSGNPELLETAGPGGLAGAASLLLGRQVEAATAAEDCVCLLIPKNEVDRLMAEEPFFAARLRSAVLAPDLFELVASHFSRRALDPRLAVAAFQQALPRAVHSVDGPPPASENDPATTWLVAAGERRGEIHDPSLGRVPCLGIPTTILGDAAADAPSPDAPPAPLPPAETLLETPRDYPEIATGGEPLQQVVACFEVLASLHQKAFPKEAVVRVLENELGKERTPTLNTCGTIASLAGFAAQLVKVPLANMTRVETPLLIARGSTICVLFEINHRHAVLGDPLNGNTSMEAGAFIDSLDGDQEVLLLRPLPDEEKGKFGLRWFLPAIRKHKRVLFEVFVASFFIQLFALANPLLVQVIIDKVLVQNSISTLNVLGVLFVLIAIAGTALTAVRTYLFVDTTNRIDLSLGSRIMDHLYKLTLGYFQRRPVGEVSSRLNELENIRQFLTGTALTVGLDALFSVVYIGVMLFYSIPLTLVALVAVPFMAGATVAAAPILRRQIRRRAEAQARSQAHLIETITGVQTVKAGNIEQPSRWEWQKRYAGYVSAGFHAVLTSTATNSVTTLMSRLGDLAVLWYGAILVIKGELTLGQLIAFRIIAGYVTTPLMRLAQSWQNFQEVALSIERLGDVMDSDPEQSTTEACNIPMPAIKGKVTFDAVTFAYGKDKQPVLKNISFEVPEGSFVGVVGKSGSGKSTLLKLLPRLYNPSQGRILIDDYEIAKVELYSLRRQIGTVLQDSLLFNSPVFDNIAVGSPDATTAEVMRAARIAGAHEFIMSLPQGYNTPVGEQGRALSGGQRQRVAIARAVLQHPRLLILDEATSALDLPSEALVCRNLADEFKGKTVFFVTHRVRSIQHADHILVFDRGHLVEQGRHEDLMRLGGLYTSLHAGQEVAA